MSTTHRKLLLKAGLLATAVTVALSGTTSAGADSAPEVTRAVKPAILLVHGAFADASSWDGVATRLRQDGYQVTMAAVGLRGLTDDVAYVHGVLESLPRKTVVVGHSYGGAVISGAATGSTKAAALVYVAAFAPDAGETVQELDQRFGGPTGKITTTRPYPLPTGMPGLPGGIPPVELTIDPAKFRHYFAQDVPEQQAANMADGQRPLALAALLQPAGPPAWKSLPSWYLLTREDRIIPPSGQRQMAERMHARVVERWASHAVTVSQPGTTAEVVEAAARQIHP
ncbi:alpha/beta fold hydrolase [Amycolatopsis orientalis]|uniref:alpha/beta fold hydrolase n=1 Tax=Amycolatopsis orientalis TaxID=31958 RepID=UPI000415978F|nr:alpha/beta hydrolase [Amycolatopsis orientalis]